MRLISLPNLNDGYGCPFAIVWLTDDGYIRQAWCTWISAFWQADDA